MRFLYIATSFPEPEKGATIYTDLAESLYEAGHEITVAVSEQAKNKKATEMKLERGFNVLRIVTGNYYDVGLIEKGITTLKIPILMKKGISKYLGDCKFDMILFEAPPVTNSGLVAWAKKKFNCPAYLMLKDIFPQNAVDIGIMKNKGLIFRYFTAKERKLYETADYIGCMSKANKEYVIKNNPWLNPGKVELFPNTKKIVYDIAEIKGEMRRQCNIPDNSCVFLFGGNMENRNMLSFYARLLKNAEVMMIYFFCLSEGEQKDIKLSKQLKRTI